MTDKQILILGGGPAATATAIGLRRIGYQIILIQSPRIFAACEGISKRTLAGLRSSGCLKAASSAAPASPKYASWNGETNSFNTEHLVSRVEFDNALINDLKAAGIKPIPGRVCSAERSGKKWRVIYQESHSNQTKTVMGDYLVEARGRSGSTPEKVKIRGPETVALLQRWQIPPDENRTASMASSYQHGWAWLAKLGTTLYTQITLSASDPRIPKKAGLQPFILDELRKLPNADSWLTSAIPIGQPIARASTCILAQEPVTEHRLRVGDAALAADPLSGNGIFQALSLGLAAPAVINTILRHPKRAKLAKQFYQERCQETYLRFCRIGRDFYAQEQRWSTQPFWRERGCWPDQRPIHSTFSPRQLQIEQRPVLTRDQILSKDVLVTPDHPLGIWQVAGIELAPIVRELKRQPDLSRDWVQNKMLDINCQQSQKVAMLGWLMHYQLIQ